MSILRGASARAAIATALVLWPAGPADAESPARTHDGFYFRWATGLSGAVDSIESTYVGDAELAGLGIGGELLVGGTPMPGIVLGGGTHGVTVFSPTLRVGSKRSSRAPNVLSLSSLAAFVDWYFDPHGGWHAEALVGLAILSADDSRPEENPLGVAIMLGGGHGWFVGDQWSIGATAQVTAAWLRFAGADGDIEETHLVIAPALLAAFVYH
jgi:hypothetical protein